jgi:hypothetical protein
MDFLDTAEKRDRRMVHLPMGRFGEAVELAKAALFRAFLVLSCRHYLIARACVVASDDSSYMTVCPSSLPGSPDFLF